MSNVLKRQVLRTSIFGKTGSFSIVGVENHMKYVWPIEGNIAEYRIEDKLRTSETGVSMEDEPCVVKTRGRVPKVSEKIF